MSITEMTITTGPFNIKMDLKCKDSVSMELCNMMKKWTDHDGGQWSTNELRDTMCEEDKSTCSEMNRLAYAGYIPLVLFPAAAMFECLSLLLLYVYWHSKPTTMVRNLSAKCGLLAAFCGAAGFVGWMVVMPQMAGFPRMWAKMAGAGDAGGRLFTGFKETWVIPLGWSLGCGMFGILGSFCRILSQYNLPPHVDEPDP